MEDLVFLDAGQVQEVQTAYVQTTTTPAGFHKGFGCATLIDVTAIGTGTPRRKLATLYP